jgi:hypothetical protein
MLLLERKYGVYTDIYQAESLKVADWPLPTKTHSSLSTAAQQQLHLPQNSSTRVPVKRLQAESSRAMLLQRSGKDMQ